MFRLKNLLYRPLRTRSLHFTSKYVESTAEKSKVYPVVLLTSSKTPSMNQALMQMYLKNGYSTVLMEYTSDDNSGLDPYEWADGELMILSPAFTELQLFIHLIAV